MNENNSGRNQSRTIRTNPFIRLRMGLKWHLNQLILFLSYIPEAGIQLSIPIPEMHKVRT